MMSLLQVFYGGELREALSSMGVVLFYFEIFWQVEIMLRGCPDLLSRQPRNIIYIKFPDTFSRKILSYALNGLTICNVSRMISLCCMSSE